MKTIVLIGCGKSKVDYRIRADQLYTGTLFRSSLEYARTLAPDAIYILSALHGLVELDKELDPYNKTLNTATKREQLEWGEKTVSELRKASDIKHDHLLHFLQKNRDNTAG